MVSGPPFNKNRDFHATPDTLASGVQFGESVLYGHRSLVLSTRFASFSLSGDWRSRWLLMTGAKPRERTERDIMLVTFAQPKVCGLSASKHHAKSIL